MQEQIDNLHQDFEQLLSEIEGDDQKEKVEAMKDRLLEIQEQWSQHLKTQCFTGE
jgi:hypothetical protein